MSWLTDLAGRAEELLNRVDQSAAGVLKKDELDSVPNYSLQHQQPVHPKSVAIVNLVPPNSSSLINTKLSPNVSSSPGAGPAPNRPTADKITSLPVAKVKSKLQIEEEKLFEFLNSDGTPSSASSKEQPAKSAGSNQRGSSPLPDVKESAEASHPSANGARNKPTLNVVKPTDGKMQVVAPPATSRHSPTIEATGDSLVGAIPQVLQMPQGTVSSQEYENRLLHNEVNSLNRELSQMLQRSKNTELEMLGLRKQLDQRSKELSAESQSIQNFRDRENDLQQALAAKDSQLAVLRVRLQEADQELSIKRPLVESLQAEKRRILEDHSSSSGIHTQAIESVQERLRQSEELMEREQANFRTVQAENFQRILKLEDELKTIASSYSESQAKLATETTRASEVAAQLKTAKHGMDCAQQELSDYKVKAQRNLQSKDRLIASLKKSGGKSASSGDSDSPGTPVSAVELEELRQERDLLKDDVIHANQQIANLRIEMQDGEAQLQDEIDGIREQGRVISEQLRETEQRKRDLELETVQLKEELRYLREDSSRQRTNLQTRLQDRDGEIERLRRQLIAKQVNTTSYTELESRLNALTESLIQKQTLLEALSTEKSALVFQLERLEQQANEKSTPSRRASSLAVNVTDDGDVKQRVPSFMVENVFDSQVTRKVKRVYNTIDSLSIRLGVFLRRYPMARTLILAYMAMLHLWVVVVLFTYTPESHGQNPKPSGK